MIAEFFILGSAAFCEAAGIYDVVMTEKGLKAKVAVEGNTWLVGTNPTAVALYLRDNLTLALTLAPSLVALVAHNTGFAIGGCAGPVVYGVKHILGGRSWAKLLKAK